MNNLEPSDAKKNTSDDKIKMEYIEPKIEIIEFDREDVITTSGGGHGFGGEEGSV